MTSKTAATATKKRIVKKTPAHQLTIPHMDNYDSYISRSFGMHTEFDIFQFCRDSVTNVLIEGPTGPGKTSAVMAYAAREKRPFYAIPSNVGIEPSQLFGKFIPDRLNGGFKWVDGPVTSIVRNGGVLLINEVNFMPERVATVLFGLLDKRRTISLLDHEAELIEAHPDLLIVADMNPDYEGTRPLNKAFRNRFGVQLWWDYDQAVEAALVKSPELRDMAARIRTDIAKGAYVTPVSTNMLQEFERIFDGLGIDFAALNFINHFTAEERPSIRQVVETFKMNIEADLTAIEDAETVVDTEEEEEDLVSKYADDDPIWGIRETASNGYDDPEWGVKGVDWTWD